MNPQYGYKSRIRFDWNFFYKFVLRFCEREIVMYRNPINFKANKSINFVKKIFRKLIK